MSVSTLLEQLAASDPGVRVRAGDALVAMDIDAVDAVLGALCDEGSPIEWSDSASVLREIGDAAFQPLVEAIAGARTGEVRRRAGWAFAGLKVSDHALYVAALQNPDPEVRSTAAYALQLQKERALPYSSALIPLLADPDDGVRRRALWALTAIGADVIPLLLRARRSAGPDGQPIVAALMEIGGLAALDEDDRRELDARIRTRIRDEMAEPMHLCGSWYALPTHDQKAVLEACDLSDPTPVTMRMGASAWTSDHHDARRREHHRCARAYVSPAMDGWTLVFGEVPGVCDTDVPAAGERQPLLDFCARLSKRFGTAHLYGMSCGDAWTAWCIAQDGEIVRSYDVEEPDASIGPPLAAEADYCLPHVDPFPDDAFEGIDLSDPQAFFGRRQQVMRDLGIPETCDATLIAARMSVDPSSLGPDTQVSGHGVLALTRCGRLHGAPPGQLDI